MRWLINFLSTCCGLTITIWHIVLILSSWTFVSISSTKSMDQVHVSVPRPRSLHIDCTALLSQPCPLYLDTGRPETARSRNLKYMYRYILLVSKHSHTSLVLCMYVHRQAISMSAYKLTFLVVHVLASSCFTVLIIAFCCNAQWG